MCSPALPLSLLRCCLLWSPCLTQRKLPTCPLVPERHPCEDSQGRIQPLSHLITHLQIHCFLYQEVPLAPTHHRKCTLISTQIQSSENAQTNTGGTLDCPASPAASSPILYPMAGPSSPPPGLSSPTPLQSCVLHNSLEPLLPVDVTQGSLTKLSAAHSPG